MRMEISQADVFHELDIAPRRAGDRVRIVYADSAARTPYIVFDSHRDAPGWVRGEGVELEDLRPAAPLRQARVNV